MEKMMRWLGKAAVFLLEAAQLLDKRISELGISGEFSY
jgi:hypothetical protein